MMEHFDIAFLGTSLTSGANWQKLVRQQLNANRPEFIQTYDFGDGGKTSLAAVSEAGRIGLMRSKVIVIELAANDAATYANVSVSAFTTNLTNVVNLCKWSLTSEIFLMTMNPFVGPGLTAAPNILDYYQAVRDVATATSVGLIDNTPDWGTVTVNQFVGGDGVHPFSSEVDPIIVPNIIEAISPLLT